MKILVTGIHSAAVAPASKKLGVRMSVGSYVAAMRDLGHDVDWRRTTPDDDPTAFDLIVCGMVPPGKIVAVDLFPVPYLIARARRSGIPVILANDDWQTTLRQTRMQAQNYGRRPHRIFENDFLYDRPYSEWAREPGQTERRELILEGLNLIDADVFPWVCCAFEWGRHQTFQSETSMPMTVLDPTPYVDFPTVFKDYDKMELWIMSALFDHSPWVEKSGWCQGEGSWDIDFYTTAKKFKSTVDGLNKMDSVRQDELLRLQADYAGGIMTPYPKRLGAGWWRHQWFTVPRSGTVLWCDPRDAYGLGNFGHDRRVIEQMTSGQRTELAAAQRTEVESKLWTKERLQHEVDLMLKGLTQT